jgi:hypothetical protein
MSKPYRLSQAPGRQSLPNLYFLVLQGADHNWIVLVAQHLGKV